MPASDAHLPALTGLRFLLAIWVVVHHLTGTGRMLDSFVRALPDPIERVVASGYVAVGTFFVLSGFVLSRSYASMAWNRANLMRYAVARYARVYPVYLLSLLILAPIMFTHLFSDRPAIADPAAKAAVLAQYGLVLQGWAETLRVHWNTPAWSLSCELFFYFCFPVAVFLLRGVRWPGVASAIAAALVMPYVCRAAGVPSAWKPLIHLGDFLIGIGAARVCEALGCLRGRGYVFYVPAAAAALAVLADPALLGGVAPVNAVLRPLNAMLLLGLALGGGLPWRALATPAAVYLGRASYSMYILHIPLLWWYKRTWFYLSGAISQTTAALIYLAGVVMVSAVVWRRVEEPANRRIRAWAAARLPKPAVAR